MGIITAELFSQLQEQVKHHRVVVWFDPDQDYLQIVKDLDLPDIHFVRYEPKKGFLSLRRELEPLWDRPQKPTLVIYIPLASQDTNNALVEYIAAGVRLEPGIQPPERNTRLSVVARRALEKVLPPAAVEKVVCEVEDGKLDLQELEGIAEKGLEVQTGALAVIFETSNPEEIALHFLTDINCDQHLQEKSAETALSDLLNEAFGLNLTADDGLSSLRSALARQLLLIDFISSLHGEPPAQFASLPIPENNAALDSIRRVFRTWRSHRDLGDSYSKTTATVEASLGLASIPWTIGQLQDSETFYHTEVVLQGLVEDQLVERPTQSLVEIADRRLNGFWASQKPEVKLRWQISQEAGQLLLLAKSIQQSLKNQHSLTSLLDHYVNQWCLFDTNYRHLERDFANYDFEPGEHDALLQLHATVRNQYAGVVQDLSAAFTRAYEEAGFVATGVHLQSCLFADFVKPALQKQKLAYFLVDAFRYEMARELCDQLPDDWQHELVPAIAMPPTVTEVGMGALMPGAEKGIALVPASAGKLAVVIQGAVLKNRSDRMHHLEQACPVPVEIVELNEIAPLQDKHLRSRLQDAQLIVVTATEEIDGLWEGKPQMARQLQDHVFDQLRRGIRALLGIGVEKVVITADHGFLAGQNLLEGEPVDPPGGETFDLHRRVWVGRGGSVIPGFMRKPISAFGLSGDMELVTSYSLGGFKASGGSFEYFHGGLSLQELIIPVLTITKGRTSVDTGKPAFTWKVETSSPKITTRFFSVVITGQAENLLAVPPKIRVELRAGDHVVSHPVSATYGFDEVTRDVSMKFQDGTPGSLMANTVTLQIVEDLGVQQVDLYLLDEVGIVLTETKRLSVEISI